jgi:hypothetical protein
MITDFARHPNFRKKLDVEQLAQSVRSWPGIKYDVSSCKSVRKLPYTYPSNYYFSYISNIKSISDSYSNTIRLWFYSNYIGQGYKNCVHFRPYSYGFHVPAKPNCKICAQTFMDSRTLTESYVKGMSWVYMEREYFPMAAKDSTWYFGT